MMLRTFVAVFLFMIFTDANADFICSPENNPCVYVVNTGNARATSDRGATAHRDEWITAPGEKYFVSPTVENVGSQGKAASCGITATQGSISMQVRVVGINGTIPATFVKKVRVTAHAETGSGIINIGGTAHQICRFVSQHVDLPQE